MKKNIGKTDSVIRIIIAVTILFFIDGLGFYMQILLAIIAAALIFTAFNGVCLLYKPFGFSTRNKKEL
jgi:hypothetical protein